MAAYPPSRQVQTADGPVVGRRLVHEGDRQVDAFQGIPYARPPVGDRRFKKPEPTELWTEVRKCTQFGDRGIHKEFPGYVPDTPMSEDCLNLNVFTPVWPPPNSSGFPVFVYVHGGGYIFDSAVKYGDSNICQTLVKKDVVVVTVQYRIGYLGLFSTGDDHCPGNNCLWDLTLALKWIQKNIPHFAGDPANVTLVGQSAGGSLVDLLSLSPHSRDLFHKVISMAGNASDIWSISDNVVESCRKAAASFGVITTDPVEQLEELRKLPAGVFALGLENIDEKDSDGPGLSLGVTPRVDGDFFPKSIKELRKEAPHKPRIVGVCRDEGLMWVTNGPRSVSTVHTVAATRFPERHFPKNFLELRREYSKRMLETTTDEESRQRAVVHALGDHGFIIGCQETVLGTLASGQEEVYMYVMDWHNVTMNGLVTANSPFQGSTHCCDVTFLLRKGIMWDFEFTEEDDKVVEVIGTYFTNFAKFGNPNGDGNKAVPVEWKPATKDSPERHLRIDKESETCDSFFDGRPRWLIESTRKHYEKA